MENLYPPENYNATEVIHMKNYFDKFMKNCYIPKSEKTHTLDEVQTVLKEDFGLALSSEELKNLEELCTTDKLKLPEENPELPLKHVPKSHVIPHVHPLIPEARSFQTVKCKEEFNHLAKELLYELKIRRVEFDPKVEDSGLVKDLQVSSTFINTINIFTPFSSCSSTENRVTSDDLKIQYVIEVLGTNTLLDLANAIQCPSDNFIIKEIETTTLDFTEHLNAKEKYPSRCFFIENVFYNDMKHPKAIDYSEVVRKWAKENNIGEFKTDSMENVTFDKLKTRLGYGYVYIHQGNCEHIVMFADSRILQKNDCLVQKRYPRLTSMKRTHGRHCFICTHDQAFWWVCDSDRLPVRKTFLCTKCLQSYHYVDGQKVGNFKLYPFHNEMISLGSAENEEEDAEILCGV
ncbi:snRNA-activating protein complex subunit 3 [Sitophilus oryzae]|uniref:snRNA-activating protein complex subunit 3 n=1 Tax=Sitophilus oryzae TaxID=7048 RepID=A0A6J2YAP1_SITOR|nr:snRNA-activating protein complex subunit 3 [Sitophilus oryzae]